jgi:chromosome segregation ATPase
MDQREQGRLEEISKELSDLRSKVEEGQVKIFESLAVISEHLKHKAEKFERIEQVLDDLETSLYGKGRERTGFLTRLDRLEQGESRRTWHLGILWTAVVALIMQVIAKLLGLFPGR